MILNPSPAQREGKNQQLRVGRCRTRPPMKNARGCRRRKAHAAPAEPTWGVARGWLRRWTPTQERLCMDTPESSMLPVPL